MWNALDSGRLNSEGHPLVPYEGYWFGIHPIDHKLASTNYYFRKVTLRSHTQSPFMPMQTILKLRPVWSWDKGIGVNRSILLGSPLTNNKMIANLKHIHPTKPLWNPDGTAVGPAGWVHGVDHQLYDHHRRALKKYNWKQTWLHSYASVHSSNGYTSNMDMLAFWAFKDQWRNFRV